MSVSAVREYLWKAHDLAGSALDDLSAILDGEPDAQERTRDYAGTARVALLVAVARIEDAYPDLKDGVQA